MAVEDTARSGASAHGRAARDYTATAKVFHWLTALLMVGSFALGFVMTGLANSAFKVELYNWHKTVGLVVLALAVLRLAWRAFNPAPPMPASMRPWERWAAGATHIALYGVLFAQPLVGLIMSWASGFPTILFGRFTLPSPIATDQALYDTLSRVHEISAWVILALVAVHAGAALRHHIVKRDTVLLRMLPGRTRRP